MKKKRGLPKGRTNNPDGRPPTVSAVTQVSVRLDQETADTLSGLERLWSIPKPEAVRRSIKEAGERHGVKGKK